MKGKNHKILIIALLFLLASLMPLVAVGDAGGSNTRAPAYKGHITSDAIWSDGWIENVVIDPDVTVTMTAGSYYAVVDDGFFYIEGTLIINGEEVAGSEVEITRDSTSWQGIVVNATGNVVIRNSTISYGVNGVVLGGLPSLIENTEISMGDTGVTITGTGNRIEGCDIHHQHINGINVREASGPNYVNHTSFDVIGEAGLLVGGSSGLRTSNIDMDDANPGINLIDSTDLEFLKTTIEPTLPSGSPGIVCEGLLTDVEFKALAVDNLKVGVLFKTDEGSEVVFDEAGFGPNIDAGLIEDAGYHVCAVLKNSRIAADNTAIGIEDPDDLTWIELINSTVSQGDIVINKGGYVNNSWWVDLTVMDANTDPLDCNLKLWNETWPIVEMELPDGKAILPVISVYWVVGTNQGEKMSTRFEITANDERQTVYTTEWDWLHDNQVSEIMVDLWPYNDIQEVVEVQEDTWLDLDLDDNFTDPEGEGLFYEYNAGLELQVNQIGGHGSGTLKIRNAEDHWFGDSWLYVRAEDPSGNFTEANVTIRVLSVNDHPYLVDPPLPVLTTEEDTPTYINFTGMADDVESDVTWTAEEVEGCTLSWDDDHMNLTITPDENWFGMLEIPLNISDGENWLHETLFVNVTPENDLPEVAFMWPNGTSIEMVEYAWNETVNITVYEVTTPEDTPVAFWINATDVETMNLTYYFDEEGLLNGMVEVETFSYLNETNQTVTVEIPMNFTYIPDADCSAGDLIMFNVSDGEADLGFWVWFNVAAVNDRPTFDPPAEWNITVDEGNLTVLDIAGMIGDVDGDELTITVSPDDYVTVNGTKLEILYTDAFEDTFDEVTITVSDGSLGANAVLVINIDKDVIIDDEEPVIGTLVVTAGEDGWTFEITGDEGQTLYVVVEDEEGGVTSHLMTYADGKYTAEIGKDDAEPGFSYHLSDEEDGDSIGDGMAGTLSDLIEPEEAGEGEDDDFPFWILILVAVIVILVILIIAVAMSRGKGADDEE